MPKGQVGSTDAMADCQTDWLIDWLIDGQLTDWLMYVCQFEEETLQSLEDAAEGGKSPANGETARDSVSAAAQRIVDEANRSTPGDNTLEGWKAKAEKAVSCLSQGYTGDSGWEIPNHVCEW